MILGCGWVGEEFAKYAISKGCDVVGTTTRPEKVHRLLDLGVLPVLHDFDQDSDLELACSDFDYVLNSIPASKKMDVLAISERFRRVTDVLHGISFKKQIYLSSIGIYPDVSGLFDEGYTGDPDLDRTLSIAEELILRTTSAVVYRLGGLFGKERIFAKYFQDRVCTTGEQAANFIHVEDVVRLIWLGFTSSLQHRIYNVVAPEHPSKQMVIESSAQKYGYRLPKVFEPENSFQKIVDGRLIAKELGYHYRYPSPLGF